MDQPWAKTERRALLRETFSQRAEGTRRGLTSRGGTAALSQVSADQRKRPSTTPTLAHRDPLLSRIATLLDDKPPPVDAGIDGAEVDLETLNELPPDVRAEVERQLMLWRATRRGAARSPPPPAPDAPKPRARSSGARPRSSSSGDAKKPAAKKKTTRRKTAPEALRPANAADVQSFFAPKPGAAKRPRWRST